LAWNAGLGVAPGDVAGVPLEHADGVLGLDRLPIRIGVEAVHVDGVRWAVGAGLERERRDPQAIVAGVHEPVEVPLLLRVHVRHEDLGDEPAVEHLPPRAGVAVVD
jgi:hypothetical protein